MACDPPTGLGTEPGPEAEVVLGPAETSGPEPNGVEAGVAVEPDSIAAVSALLPPVFERWRGIEDSLLILSACRPCRQPRHIFLRIRAQL